MLIIITGTPGTGKSTLAVALAQQRGWKRIDLHEHYPALALSYDKQKQCYDLDQKAFVKLLKEKVKGGKDLILDSHVGHLLPANMVGLCVVLVCSDLKKLKKRLEKRGYATAKVRENLDTEIFQVCLMEAKEHGHTVVVFDTGMMSTKEILGKILRTLAGNLTKSL